MHKVIRNAFGRQKESFETHMDVEGIPHGPVTDPTQTLQIMAQERVTGLVGIPVFGWTMDEV